MALTATTTPIGGRDVLVQITGTTVGVAEGVELTDLPRKCRVIRHKAVASGGTVTTIETVLTRTLAALTGVAVELRATPIGDDASPALPLDIDVQPTNPIKALTNSDPLASSGSLFYHPQPDAADGSLEAEFIFRGGWE
jgi:hypothetical protein